MEQKPAKLMLIMLGLNPRMSKAGFLGVVSVMEELRGGDRGKSVLIDTVVVEYDGDRHLLAPKVIDDKKRDSFLQSTGVTVFRIQEPVYSTDDRVSVSGRQERLDDKISEHCKDIINFFRTKLLRSGSLLADKAKVAGSELRGCD
ncbi:hypothetical protein [Photobacterium damselae]|uniref:hypothetical protein n=1 Tax=Photobacterium damselae TaxID=38293 RepID=UPI0040689228